MSKAQKQLVTPFTVSKDDKGYHFMVADTFRTSAVKAATDIDAALISVTPVAINLWKAYKKVVVTDAVIGRLTFFNAFDQTIPATYGKPGSAERKALDTHKIYNRLTYLTFKVGKIAAGDGPAKRDPKVAKQEAAKKQTVFASFCKQYKLPAQAIKALVLNILGMKAKDGTFTKKGTAYLKAAGLSVAE